MKLCHHNPLSCVLLLCWFFGSSQERSLESTGPVCLSQLCGLHTSKDIAAVGKRWRTPLEQDNRYSAPETMMTMLTKALWMYISPHSYLQSCAFQSLPFCSKIQYFWITQRLFTVFFCTIYFNSINYSLGQKCKQNLYFSFPLQSNFLSLISQTMGFVFEQVVRNKS